MAPNAAMTRMNRPLTQMRGCSKNPKGKRPDYPSWDTPSWKTGMVLIGPLRQLKVKGLEKVNSALEVTMMAYNLVRMAKLQGQSV